MWLNWAVLGYLVMAAGISEEHMSSRDKSCNGDSCSKIATSSWFDSLGLQVPEQTIQPVLFEIFPFNTQFLAQCLLIQIHRIYKLHWCIRHALSSSCIKHMRILLERNKHMDFIQAIHTHIQCDDDARWFINIKLKRINSNPEIFKSYLFCPISESKTIMDRKKGWWLETEYQGEKSDCSKFWLLLRFY